jgi:hypothetical protein
MNPILPALAAGFLINGLLVASLLSGAPAEAAALRSPASPETSLLRLAGPCDEAGANAQGSSLLLHRAAGTPGFSIVMRSCAATGNANLVTGLTNLIGTRHAYDLNSRLITAAGQPPFSLTETH